MIKQRIFAGEGQYQVVVDDEDGIEVVCREHSGNLVDWTTVPSSPVVEALAAEVVRAAQALETQKEGYERYIADLIESQTDNAFHLAELEKEVLQLRAQQAALTNGSLTKIVGEAISEALDDALDCGRVWSAWGVGTMSENDFSRVADDPDRVAELASAALAAIAPPSA